MGQIITIATIIISELIAKTTAIVVIQDLVRTILIEMILVMLLIMTEMMEIMTITIIIITIKSVEVSDNSMPTICMTQYAFQSMWTKPNDFRFHSCDLPQQIHPPPLPRRSNKVDRRKKFKKRSRDSSGKHIGLPLLLVTGQLKITCSF